MTRRGNGYLDEATERLRDEQENDRDPKAAYEDQMSEESQDSDEWILEVNQVIGNFMKSWIKFDTSSNDMALSAKPDAMVLLNQALAVTWDERM